MPRQKTGRPLGRPPLYHDDERPVTVSLRIPHDLAAQMKRYASLHRQSVTELLLDGLKWRIGEDNNQYYENTAIGSDTQVDTEATAVLAEIRTALASQATQLHALVQALEQRPAVSPPDTYYGNTTQGHPRQQSTPEPVQEEDGVHSTPEAYVPGCNTVLQEEARAFDPARFVLGPLCQKGHDYDGQGHSLRQIGGKHECVACKNARSLAYKQRQRQKGPA